MSQALSSQAVEKLHEALKRRFGTLPDALPEVKPAPDGANKAVHLTAEYPDGTIVGLKANKRLEQQGGLRNTSAVAEVAEELEVSGRRPGHEYEPLDDVGPLSGRPFRARMWNPGKRLDKLSSEERSAIREDPAKFLESYGEWITVGLLCSTRDNSSKHWVWDPEAEELTRIDNEESFQKKPVMPQEFRHALNIVGLTERIKEPGSEEREALRRGIIRIVERAREKRDHIQETLAREGLVVSSGGYLEEGKTAAEVADELLEQL